MFLPALAGALVFLLNASATTAALIRPPFASRVTATPRKTTPTPSAESRFMLQVKYVDDTSDDATFNRSKPTFLYVSEEGADNRAYARGRVRASTSFASQFRMNGSFINLVGREASAGPQRFAGTFTLPYDLSTSMTYAPTIDQPYEYTFDESATLVSVHYETPQKNRVCVGNHNYDWWRSGTTDFPLTKGLKEPELNGTLRCQNIILKRVQVLDLAAQGDVDLAGLDAVSKEQ
ncbi:MAG: hypothetical protein M1832_002125 [Thelocarpon impressellum]|nr:MAG: hypothetical protein M1832_002125 [Thelocarpon impressellum]